MDQARDVSDRYDPAQDEAGKDPNLRTGTAAAQGGLVCLLKIRK